MQTLLLVVIVVLVASIVVLQFRRSRQRDKAVVKGVTVAPQTARTVSESDDPTPLEAGTPTKIVIGDNPSQPVVTIEAATTGVAYQKAKKLDLRIGTISRLSAVVQAAPSILVAAEVRGKQLMEVVVNGDLARAVDGNGFRGFVLGTGGVKEQARLFEVKNLQNMVNAAAVWQIASVVVAQKHLADISEKLDEIEAEVKDIARFLDSRRKARFQSTYEYLGQAYEAI